MKFIFFLLAVLVALAMVVCIVVSRRKKSNISKYISYIHIITFVSIVIYLISINTENETVAYILNSLYYVFIDWLFLAFADFMIAFTETPFDSPLTKMFRTDFRILAIADSLLLLSTFYTKIAFTLTKNVVDGKVYSWIEKIDLGYYVHSIFNYAIAFGIGVFFVKKIYSSARFYKRRYFIIFTCFFILMLSNSLFVYVIKTPFRFSIISYAIVACAINYIAFEIIPRDRDSKIKTLISEYISNSVICFDMNGNCIFMNHYAKKIFRNKQKCYEKFKEYNSQGSDIVNRKEYIEVDGQIRTFNVISHRLRDKLNRRIGTYMTLSDISDEIERYDREKYRSTHDLLTNVYNRNTFFKEAEALIRISPNIQRYFIVSNIKNFKIINDVFDSRFGDEILKTQANILTEVQKDDCIIGRISGDKFAMLIQKELFDLTFLTSKLSQLQDFIDKSDKNYRIQILLGIYEIFDPYENVFTMYDKANLAIKNIKDSYEKIVSFYDTSIMEQLVYEKKIIGMFDKAISERQFCMYLQPQISSTSKKAVGAEALVRWITPEKEMIPPSQFVPILENSGYIYQLDKFIWEEAARKLSEWKNRNIDLYIAINISAKDFYYLDLYKIFTSLVEKYKIAPQKLKLEITETVLMHDIKNHVNVLAKLQAYGFFIEMDDFGSGYSSLSMLKNIKMDVLKIDMAFLKKTEFLNQNKTNEATERKYMRSKTIVKSIIQMAKKLGMTVVTEGVEEEEHVKFLTESGCDIFQGYLFSKPISVNEFVSKYITKLESHSLESHSNMNLVEENLEK